MGSRTAAGSVAGGEGSGEADFRYGILCKVLVSGPLAQCTVRIPCEVDCDYAASVSSVGFQQAGLEGGGRDGNVECGG
jgi:hypothetical protein